MIHGQYVFICHPVFMTKTNTEWCLVLRRNEMFNYTYVKVTTLKNEIFRLGTKHILN